VPGLVSGLGPVSGSELDVFGFSPRFQPHPASPSSSPSLVLVAVPLPPRRCKLRGVCTDATVVFTTIPWHHLRLKMRRWRDAQRSACSMRRLQAACCLAVVWARRLPACAGMASTASQSGLLLRRGMGPAGCCCCWLHGHIRRPTSDRIGVVGSEGGSWLLLAGSSVGPPYKWERRSISDIGSHSGKYRSNIGGCPDAKYWHILAENRHISSISGAFS
jgi:hypothetical protein